MDALWQDILNFLRDKWPEVVGGLLLAVFGWYIGRNRARAQWQRRDFLHRLNVSLNLLLPAEPLQIRTLLEKGCEEIFLNKLAVESILQAAKRTTPQNPLLPLPKEDYWFYLNAVLNEISERFAEGQVRRDLGLSVTKGLYLVCLTSECAGEVRTRKVRAMVIRKDVLTRLPPIPPQLEAQSHKTRWETLHILAKEYQKNPHQFIEVELVV